MSNPYNPGPRFQKSSPYGVRRDPFTGKPKFHSGQDFSANQGTPIPAATPGKVVYSGYNDKLGNTVIVRNPYGDSLYAHMQNEESRPQVGQQIWPDDLIGLVGSTGARSTAPHLHYTVIKAGTKINESPRGGKLGVVLDQNNTIDPSEHDTAVPYSHQTLRAARAMVGPSNTRDALVFDSRGGYGGLAPPQFRPSARDGGALFADRFGNWTSLLPEGSASTPDAEPRGLPGLILDYMRRQKAQEAGAPTSSGAGTDPIPFMPDDGGGSFADRFGDRPPLRRLTSRWDRY